MTQEDKELLLKDLCARLLYGVKCCIYNFGENTIRIKEDILWSVQGDNILTLKSCVEKGEAYMYHQIKPYLFPLSSMTVEQMCKVQNLLPDNCDISFKTQKITFYDEGNIQLKQLEKIFKFFNLYHLDYRGLIEKGLAIDATGKNIY